MASKRTKNMADDGSIPTVDNYIAGQFVKPIKGRYLDVVSPSTGKTIARVANSTSEDIDVAVAEAKKVLPLWSGQTMKVWWYFVLVVCFRAKSLLQDIWGCSNVTLERKYTDIFT
jgi:hypothetical protein